MAVGGGGVDIRVYYQQGFAAQLAGFGITTRGQAQLALE